jgi:hypothetical protein
VLIPGPDDEQKIVQEIYRAFVDERKSETEIADDLNRRGVESATGRAWTRGVVHQLLINPKYVGSNVYNRRSFKLKQRRVVNPEAMWVRKDGAFPAIVTLDHFIQAGKIIEDRSRRYSESELIEKLRELYIQKGKLSGILIDEMEAFPSSSVYRTRFGSLRRAYSFVGYTPLCDYAYIEINRALRAAHAHHVAEIISELSANGASVESNPDTGILTINQDFTAALVIARCRTRPSGRHSWLIRLEHSRGCDVTIAARMTDDNNRILDYYLLPKEDELAQRIRLAPENSLVLDVYRFENLNLLYKISRRMRIGDAA